MGKKKSIKVQRPEDCDEEASGSVDSDEQEAESHACPATKKMIKKVKKKKQDDADDIAKELEDMTLEQKKPEQTATNKLNGTKKDLKKMANSKGSKKQPQSSNGASEEEEEEEDEEEEEHVVVKSKFSGFAALANDDMMVDMDDDQEEQDEMSEDDEPAPTPPCLVGKNKKAAKKAPAPAPEEDDWDLLTTPLQEEQKNKNKKSKRDKKKGKKKQQDDDDDEDFDKLLEEARLADGVATALSEEPGAEQGREDGERAVETKSKKKRKKKGKDETEAEEAVETESSTPAKTLASAETPAPEVCAPKDDTLTPVADTLVTQADTPPTKDDIPATKADTVFAEADFPVPKADSPAPTAAAPVSGNSTPGLEQPGTKTPLEDGGLSQKSKKQKKKEAEDEKKRKKKEEEEKKQQKKEEEEEKKRAKKGLPNKKILAAMKELQIKQREEEEQLKREEEEANRIEEERVRLAIEKKQQDEERKERKKQKEKERKERLKAEGKLFTAKQRADQKRAQEMLEHLKAQGVSIPDSGTEKKAPRLGSKKAYAKKKTQARPEEKICLEEDEEVEAEGEQPLATSKEGSQEKSTAAEDDEIKDSWDISSEEEEEEEEAEPESSASVKAPKGKDGAADESSDDVDDDGSDEGSSEEEEEEEILSVREKVIERLRKRKEANEANRDLEALRAPVVCVLGHVDHGKTKILDKLRRTNVQEGEVGGITQQIGATNVPLDAITLQTKMVKSCNTENLRFPGLLIIDTPGHESFSNLRNRGSSLCDIAILVVDITQGLEPQTLESIDLLKKRKTPFLVALNKVDRVFEWESNQHKDIRDVIKVQKETATNDFERRTKDIIMKLNEQGLNAALFFENPDPRSYVSLVPTSAITGDGMGNLIALICDMCQNKLAPQLRYTDELQCIVLEVKTIQGHGTTIDVILVNGRLREGDTIVLPGTDGAIVTQIRSLLMPKPMKEIRVKGSYDEFKEIKAAQGVKVAAKDLDKAIAGLSLRVAAHEDEVEVLKELADRDLKLAMRAIKVKDKGVYVQASTLGALEALLEFFKTKDIPYSGIRVGPVVKRDVMKAAAMLEHDEKYAVILAFDVRVERDAQDLADREGVKIFSEETIYHLGDRYVEYLENHKRKMQDENRSVAIFPCKLKIMPTAVFNKRDPIVLGVTVDSGVLRTGTLLCVPGKEFVEIGVVTSMEFDHKPVDIAKKGVDVCIKIDPAQGSTPKLYGRHFEHPDEIVSKISRESINACKEFFRDDLSKADWKLMAELKKLFNIL